MLAALASSSLVALLLHAGSGAAPSPRELAGRYGLRGTARVHAPPLADGDLDAAADATVSAPAGDEIRIRLTWGKATCELAARAGLDGALAFEPGQTCELLLDEPEVRGKVHARLRSARGEARGGALALVGTWELSGALSVRVGGRGVDVLGTELPIPGAWSPRTPVDGSADVKVRGERRAAPR